MVNIPKVIPNGGGKGIKEKIKLIKYNAAHEYLRKYFGGTTKKMTKHKNVLSFMNN